MHGITRYRINTLLLIIAVSLYIIAGTVMAAYAAEGAPASESGDPGSEDIIEENAEVTRGNASGDAVKTSGQMDFYTIRTANHQTYYLVIDHSGAVDNVYLLSTIDENDLQDFVESGNARNGGLVVLPDSKSDQEDPEDSTEESGADTEKHESGNVGKRLSDITANQTAGIASLAIIAVAGIFGVIALVRKRKRAKEEEEYADENLEYDDGFRTVSEDDDL